MQLTLPPSAAMTDSDQALLAAWHQGDAHAFTILVERHHALVFNACRRQLGAADADDAAQAVFLVLTRKRDEAMASPVLVAWLLAVARHVCATARRGNSRRHSAEQEAAVQNPTEQHQPIESDAVGLLDEALATLPERERIAISLHYLSGRPHAAIAVDLRCPVNTVYSLLHRGLERVRTSMRRRGVVIPLATLSALLLSEQASAAELTWSASTTTALAHGEAASSTINQLSTGAIQSMSRIRLRRRALTAAALLLLGGSTAFAVRMAAADATPIPPAAISTPRETPVVADSCPGISRLIDLDRSRQRFATGPYGKILATPWGAMLAKKLSDEPQGKAFIDSVIGLKSATVRGIFGISPVIQASLVPVGNVDQYHHLLTSFITTLPPARPGQDLTFEWPLAASPTSVRSLPDDVIAHAADGNADAELCVSGVSFLMSAITTAAGLPTESTDQSITQMRAQEGKTLDWTQMSFRLEPFGMRERNVSHMTAEGLKNAAKYPGNLVTIDAFASLSADTLCAASVGLETYISAIEDPQGQKPIIELLEKFHLPTLDDLRKGLHGQALIAMESGSPLPVGNAWIGMDQALADKLLAIVDAQLGLIDDGTGVHGGFLGMIPIAAAYRDGSLVITTHPLGLAGITGRPAGFLTQPDIRAAIKEIPDGGANLIGLSRSRASWAALTGLAAPMLAAQGMPECMTMPQDIQKFASYGFCWSKQIDSTMVFEAGGLFGGSTTIMAVAGTTAAALSGDTSLLLGAVGMLAR